MRGRLGALALEVAGPIAIVAVWWVASASSTSLYFPPLETILGRFRDVWLGAGFADHAVPSLGRSVVRRERDCRQVAQRVDQRLRLFGGHDPTATVR